MIYIGFGGTEFHQRPMKSDAINDLMTGKREIDCGQRMKNKRRKVNE